jgi:tetratricopeptide (TPR) repeat protein
MQQQTSQSEGLISLFTWFEVNRKKILIGAAAAAVVILVAVVFFNYQIQKEVRASEALSEIRVPLNPATALPAETVPSLLQFAQEHQGTKAAARALLIAGGFLFADKKYTEAQQEFTRLTQDYGDTEWLPQAFLGLAATLDAQSKTNEAIAEYERLRKRFANHAVADEAKLALARLYEAQKPEEAYKLYDELVKANPMTGLGAEAGLRKEDLKEKHPDLAKLDAPILPPQPTPGAPNITNRPMFTITNRVSGTSPARKITLTNRPSASTSQIIRLPQPGSAPSSPGTPTPSPPVAPKQ